MNYGTYESKVSLISPQWPRSTHAERSRKMKIIVSWISDDVDLRSNSARPWSIEDDGTVVIANTQLVFVSNQCWNRISVVPECSTSYGGVDQRSSLIRYGGPKTSRISPKRTQFVPRLGWNELRLFSFVPETNTGLYQAYSCATAMFEFLFEWSNLNSNSEPEDNVCEIEFDVKLTSVCSHKIKLIQT